MPIVIKNLCAFDVTIVELDQDRNIIGKVTYEKPEISLTWIKAVQHIYKPVLIKHDVWDDEIGEFNLNFKPEQIDNTFYITSPDIVIGMLNYNRSDFMYPESPIYDDKGNLLGYEWLRKL